MFNLNDSNSNFSSIVNSVHGTFYPEGQVQIRNTSYYSRDFGNQLTRERTFASYSLTRAMSGDALYRNPKFANVFYNSALHSSLNSVVVGGSEAAFTTVNTYKRTNPDDAYGAVDLKGGTAMSANFADSVIGKIGGDEFVQTAAASIANDFSIAESFLPVVSSGGNSTTANGEHSTTGFTGDGTNPGSGARVVALDSQMSTEEKAWYKERAQKLGSYNTVYDYAGLNGFTFDLDNSLNSIESTGSHYPGVPDAGGVVPKSIIDMSSQKAYICPAMIELLIFLNTKIEIRGGFGFGRGADPSKQGSNLTPLKDGDYVSDHVFGRAFDIDIVGPLNQPNSGRRIVIGKEGANKDKYITALEVLFEALSSAPLHLIPDLFGISSDLNEEFGISKKFEEDTARIKVSYPCIKYANFSSDTIHRTHIHMSFSGSRSGIYAGPNGILAGASTTSSAPGQAKGAIKPAGTTGSADTIERNSSGNSTSSNLTNGSRSPDRIDRTSRSNPLADLNLSTDAKNNKTTISPLAQLNLETDKGNTKAPDNSGAIPVDTVTPGASEINGVPAAGNDFLNFVIRVRSENPFAPKTIVDTTGTTGYTATGDFAIPSDLNSPKFTNNYSNDGKTALELGEIYALLRMTIMSDEAAALFTAIAEREGGKKPGSFLTDNGSGDWSFGLWGINLLPRANGNKVMRIPYPSVTEKLGWQLGYKNWQAEGIDSENFRRKAFQKVNELGGKENSKPLFDPLVWYPINQAYILYTTATSRIFNSEKLGVDPTSDGNFFFPWGDYSVGPSWGWISNVKFSTAAGLYTGSGKSLSGLQEWVIKFFETAGKKSKSAQYARNWTQGYMYKVSYKHNSGWVNQQVIPPSSAS